MASIRYTANQYIGRHFLMDMGRLSGVVQGDRTWLLRAGGRVH